jgi:hypothetical protein
VEISKAPETFHLKQAKAGLPMLRGEVCSISIRLTSGSLPDNAFAVQGTSGNTAQRIKFEKLFILVLL